MLDKKINCSKIEMLVKNYRQARNIAQKSDYQSKIKILIKNLTIFAKNQNMNKKSNYQSKIKILIKNRTISQKSKYVSKIGLLVKNRKFFKKLKLWLLRVYLVTKQCEI